MGNKKKIKRERNAEMAWNVALAPTLHFAPSKSDSVSSLASSSSSLLSSSFCSHRNNCRFGDPSSAQYASLSTRTGLFRLYVTKLKDPKVKRKRKPPRIPDPSPEFGEAETEKFRTNLLSQLSKKPDVYGEKAEEITEICAEIMGTYLSKKYRGPQTLDVFPFLDMVDAIQQRELPSGEETAREALIWCRDHVDKDWKAWMLERKEKNISSKNSSSENSSLNNSSSDNSSPDNISLNSSSDNNSSINSEV